MLFKSRLSWYGYKVDNEVSSMILHFTYKTFVSDKTRRRAYLFSFFYKGILYRGIYHHDGSIEWHEQPAEEDMEYLISHIHEIMLFHVYDS